MEDIFEEELNFQKNNKQSVTPADFEEINNIKNNIGGSDQKDIEGAFKTIKDMHNSSLDSIKDLVVNNKLPKSESVKNSFDYSTLSKNKFSKGNTTPVNLFNSLKEKGLISFEVGDNDETKKATKLLLGGIDEKLVSDDLPGMLTKELNLDTYGEKFGGGFARFISQNNPEIDSTEFSNISEEIVKPLNNNGYIKSLSEFNSAEVEKAVATEVSGRVDSKFVEDIKNASSFLYEDKSKNVQNPILDKIRNNESLTIEEAKEVKKVQYAIDGYKDFIKDTATKYGVSEASVINNMPNEIKSSMYYYNNSTGTKGYEFNKPRNNTSFDVIDNLDIDINTGNYTKKQIVNNDEPKDIFENLLKKQGYAELGDINSQDMGNVLSNLKNRIEDIDDVTTKEYIEYADELSKNGISIGEEGERLLKTYNSVLENTSLNDQNKTAILGELKNISPSIDQNVVGGISKENFKYLKSGLIDYQDGKFVPNKKSISYLNSEELKEFETLIKSESFGTENLDSLNERIDKNIFTDSVKKTTGNNNLNYQQIEDGVNSTIRSLKEGKLKTVDGIGLNTSEILNSAGITGNEEKVILDAINSGESLSYNFKTGNAMKQLYESGLNGIQSTELDEIYFGNVSDDILNYFSEDKSRTLIAENKIKNNPKELTDFLSVEDKKSLVEQHLKNKLGAGVFNNSQTPEFSENTMNDMIQEMDNNYISEKLSSKVEEIKKSVNDPIINLTTEEETIISQMRNGNLDSLKGKTLEELDSLSKKGEHALFKKDKIQEFKNALNLETNVDGIFGKGHSFKLKKDAFKDKDDLSKWINGLADSTADELRTAFGEKFEVFEESFKVEDKSILDKIVDFTKNGVKRYNSQGKNGIDQISDEIATISKEFGIIDDIDGKNILSLFNKEAINTLRNDDFDNIKMMSSGERLKKAINSVSKENDNKIIDSAKGLLKGNKGKTGLLIGAIAASAFIGSAVSNAADERRRKEMELNQLIMATNQGYRGAY